MVRGQVWKRDAIKKHKKHDKGSMHSKPEIKHNEKHYCIDRYLALLGGGRCVLSCQVKPLTMQGLSGLIGLLFGWGRNSVYRLNQIKIKGKGKREPLTVFAIEPGIDGLSTGTGTWAGTRAAAAASASPGCTVGAHPLHCARHVLGVRGRDTRRGARVTAGCC